MASRMDQMQATIEALRGLLAEATTEFISIRAAANASATAIANRAATLNTAWHGQAARMNQLEPDVTDVQGHVRRGGGDGDRSYKRDKGALKEFSGDTKLYRGWTKKVQAFFNTMRPRFRKALLWAAEMKEPIAGASLRVV